MRRGLVALVLVATAPLVHAQSIAKADLALKQIDDGQCDAAIASVNQGLLDQEPKAHYIAGQLFQHGYCLRRNVPRALSLYERGALLGDPESARALALVHARGDGVPQSYPEAGRWYAATRPEKSGGAEPTPASFAEPAALVLTYIEAVKDLAFDSLVYPKDAAEKGVTGTVRIRFDPRFARVMLLSSTDNLGGRADSEPNRHDFARALLSAYGDAIRILPKPAMSPNVDNAVEQTVIFNRKVVAATDQPIGLRALPR